MHSHDNAEALLRILREPRRNKFFYGKRMDVQHFQVEQDYGKLKQWLLNRLTLGKGVLCGLNVSVVDGKVCVEPGVAIDGLGREIIVPLRYCLDPVVVDEGCCEVHGHPPSSAPPADRVVDGLFTLWLCYRECLTDHQPVLVSDCGTRDECAPGTLVETFCLKFGQGMSPPLGDPAWCAKLWGTGGNSLAVEVPAEQQDAAQAALDSRRHLLCKLFKESCDPAEGDPCVPLAVVQVKSGQVRLEACLVRPRIYSNERLLELILCLADRIEECCGGHSPVGAPPQVRSVEFIRRSANGTEQPVAGMATPLQDTLIDINGKTNAIRIRFTQPLATDEHKPSTHGPSDPDFQLHNVQVLPERPLEGVPFVPGTLVLEQPDTLRFDLARESPYSRGADGWQKGRYQVLLRGDEDLARGRHGLPSAAGTPLDGEPIARAAGVISGNGTAGGNFSAFFVVRTREEPPPPAPPSLMHVRRIEFLGLDRELLAAVDDPTQPVVLAKHITAIRFAFDKAFAPAGNRQPSVAGLDDPDFRTHNVQLRLSREAADRFGTRYIAGRLEVEDGKTFRVDLARGTRLINQDGRWVRNQRIECEIFLRGDAAPEGPELDDTNGLALDGNPHAPAGGLISGDGSAGGDFIARFIVHITE